MSDFGHAGSKDDLVPPVPVLTRHRREAGIKAFVKKELFDSKLHDERRSAEISVHMTQTLCVQLNTLYVSSGIIFIFCFFFSFVVDETKILLCFILIGLHAIFIIYSFSKKERKSLVYIIWFFYETFRNSSLVSILISL